MPRESITPRSRLGLMLASTLVCVAVGQEDRTSRTIRLLDDTRFERGFTVWSAAPGRHVSEGTIRPSDSRLPPVWGLAQWHSRFTLAEAEKRELPDGSVRFADGGKSVVFFPPAAEADIAFALNGLLEYQGKAPRPGDPWPHLLAERTLAAHPAVTELKAVPFAVRYRLVHAEVHRPQGFDARRHTAQFLFYLTVQNQNRRSAGFGDYFWFGVQMYDTRYRLPREHMALDRGSDRKPATGKFIFNPGGERYTSASAQDGDWVTIEKDLLPLIVEGLETAWRRGFLKDSRQLSDYRLGGMNTGWEVTGPLDVEMQLAGLKLDAVLAGE